MAGKIVIDTERCKGCGLCVIVCPKNAIVISDKSNKNGFFPAQPVPSVVEGAKNSDCTGCCLCALICPEVTIEVSRDDNTVVLEPDRKSKSTLV
jgi:2-oxoglutarate ferredoxin oxidoreductase subunit delta